VRNRGERAIAERSPAIGNSSLVALRYGSLENE